MRRLRTRDENVIDFTWKDYERQMTRDVSVSLEGATNVFQRLKEINLPVVSDKLSDHVDTKINDGLKQDGFIAGLEKQYPSKQEIKAPLRATLLNLRIDMSGASLASSRRPIARPSEAD